MAGCFGFLRVIVCILNIIFWIAGAIMLGMGLWLLFDPSVADFFSLHAAHPDSYQIVGWLLVAAGAIMCLTGCCGCIGAWKENSGALTGFFLVLVIVFCLEISAAFIAYKKQETIRNFIESSMYDTVRNRYAPDTPYKEAFDRLQSKNECCGVKSYTDWLGASWDRKQPQPEADGGDIRLEHGIGAIGGRSGKYGRVPASCCNEHGLQTYPGNCGISFNQAALETYSEYLYTKGCGQAIFDYLYSYFDCAIFICVLIGSLQLLAMAFTMILCCTNNDNDKRY